MTKWERFAANANKIKVKGEKNKMLDGLGASLKEQILKAQEDQIQPKPMTKFERFAANAKKI